MPSKPRFHVLAAILAAVVILGAAYWHNPGDGKSAPAEQKPVASAAPAATSSGGSFLPRRESKPAVVFVPTSLAVATLEALKNEWSEAEDLYEGEELLAKQREISVEAVRRLGGSLSILEYLDFLEVKHAGDLREWVLDVGMAEAFSGENARSAREWIVPLASKTLQARLAFHAGRGFKGAGFEGYLARFKDKSVQSSLLTGYCITMAATKPEEAVKAYTDLRPEGVDFSGLERVMSSLPPGSDFGKIAGTIPDDGKTLARRARGALLGSWAKEAPVEAAQYVISNTKTVAPEQLGVVVDVWLASNPTEAQKWVQGLSSGPLRDRGLMSESSFFAKSDPPRALGICASISDLDQRIAAAKGIYEIWSKLDKQSADAAWDALFPPKK